MMLVRKPTLRNPLAFPAGTAPGFDPSHLASRNGITRFSGVARNGSMISLLKGQVGSTTPVFAFDSIGGPITGADVSFSGNPAVADKQWTCAAIINFVTGGGNTFRFVQTSTTSGGGGAGHVAGINASGLFVEMSGGVGLTSPATNVGDIRGRGPHFVGISRFGPSGSGGSFTFGWAKSLATGTLKITSLWNDFGYAETASDGVYVIPITGSGGTRTGVMAAMFSTVGISSVADVAAWANDPWAFWYPRNIDLTQNTFGAAAVGGSFLAAWAMNSNLPVIGTGTY
jgi:hypothetical protein